LALARDSGCASWTDISGSSQSVAAPEQARKSGEAWTFDGDNPIVQSGKREPIEIVVEIIYTETDGEAFEFVRGEHESDGCDNHLCLRYSPGGNDAGDALYTTSRGVLTNFIYPPMNASEGGPILAGFTLKVAGITTSVVAPS
jgi:hypothetical protein